MIHLQTKVISLSDKPVLYLLFCTVSVLFLLSEQVRMIFSQSSFFVLINPFFICIGSLTIGVLLFKQYLDILSVLLTLAFMSLAIITLIIGGRSLSEYIMTMVSMIMPFLLAASRLSDDTYEVFLDKFIKAANIIVIVLVISGICDYLSGTKLQILFVKYGIFAGEQARFVLFEHSSGIYRLYSIFGHPLLNAWYILTFYSLNILFNRFFRKLLNEYILISVTIIGLLLCGSRSGLVIGVVMCVLLNNFKHKVFYTFSFAIIAVSLAWTSLFKQNLLKRFMNGVNSRDYSGGRNEALLRVVNNYVEWPSIFTGGGVSYSRLFILNMGRFIHSFEYPFIMFAYDFGIVGTILIYSIIFIIPSLIILHHKNYFILIFFWLLSIYVNGFNILANYSDYMGQFCVIVMIMVNMSYFIKRRQERDSNI